MSDKRRVLPLAVLASTSAAFILAVATILPVAVFGLQGAQMTTRSFMYLSTVIFFPDTPFENFTFYARLSLLTNSVFTVAVMIWTAARLLRFSFAKKSTDTLFIIGVSVASWVIQSLVQQSVEWRLFSYWTIIIVYCSMLSFGLLIPLAAWKTRKGQKPATQ